MMIWNIKKLKEQKMCDTEQINNIAVSINYDKRLQLFDKIITHPYGTNASKKCENEMVNKYK